MKFTRFPLLLLLLTFLAALAAPRARAAEEVSFDYFYDNLKPYGEWVQVADYGLCWHPADVSEDWAPYTDGYWAYTDAGWTWVSYEDFGDIVYHYGRWVHVDDEGWCWVPDNDWGPAWVSWRNSDEVVGWAPLPPEAHFRPEIGISVWADETYDIGPGYYHFCYTRDFGAPVIREVCLPRARNVVFFDDTVNITNITFNTGYGYPFCGGPRYDFISSRVLRPIPALKLVRETNITNITNINVTNNNGRGGNRRSAFASVQRGNTLVMPAPRVRPIVDRNAPLPNLRPAKVLAADRVTRGWTDVSPQDRERLRATVKQQTKGATPESAPARAFTQADVKAVPRKADPTAVSPAAAARGRGKPIATTPAEAAGVSGGREGRPSATIPPGEEPRRAPATTSTLGKGRGAKPGAPITATTDSPAVAPRPVPPTNVPTQPFRRGTEKPAAAAGAETRAEALRQRQVEMQREQPPIARSRPLPQEPVVRPRQAEPEAQNAVRQQQATVARERSAAAGEARQQQAAAAAARERSAAVAEARERASVAAARQQGAAEARQRAVEQQQRQPQVQRAPQNVPQRGVPQDPRAKGKTKDKDDDKR